MLRNLALLIFTLIASAQQQNPSGRSNAARYRIVHSVIIDGKEEFISVAVRPGISTSELTAIATELHRLHPKSNLDFYDQMNAPRIKHWWKCFVDTVHKIDNPSCPDGPDEWINFHKVGSVSSSFDNPQHTGQPRWYLEGKAYRRIASLGIDDRPPETPAPTHATERLKVGQTGILHWSNAVDMAFTAQDYSLFTKCFDGRSSIDCAARLFNAKKMFHVPNGTRAQVLEYRDNPLHSSLLKGQLLECRILDGAFKGMSLWTLEDHLRPR